MIINTNIASLNTQNNLTGIQNDMQKVMQRLSSGKRINGASDDAAGLAIVTRMDSAIRGYDVSSRNIQDGVSLIQTAESANGTITNILQRMRDLSVQADNGTYTVSDKQFMENEYTQLKNEIDHIAQTTTFNGVNLLNSAANTLVTLHVSNLSSDTALVTIYNATSASLGVDKLILSVNGSGPQNALASIDAALASVSNFRAAFGAMQNRLNFTLDNITSAKQNLTAAQSRIQDADMAQEISRQTRDTILSQAALSVLSQANQQTSSVLKLLQ